jgi:site-specific recombinase XerD
MKKQQDIHEAISIIMESLENQGHVKGTMKNYRNSFNVFESYLAKQGITHIGEDVCLDYIFFKTGTRPESFETTILDANLSRRMNPLHLLLMYLETGEFQYHARKTKKPFLCPECFQAEFSSFCKECEIRDYAPATIDSNKDKVQYLLTFLEDKGVKSSDEITIQHIEEFLATYQNAASKYIGTILYVLRNYFSFLHERGYITEDLSNCLPKVRTPRNGRICYAWEREEVKKLLDAIDRESSIGKRDYAIILLAVRLGLRISDIRGLQLTSFNWNRKTIKLVMKKTGQELELPLPDDIGWAVIDYLKNGRPRTISDRLLVRHRPPFTALGERDSFGRQLHRYVVKAGLTIPCNIHYGMHSLRNTFARNLLEAKVPLPVISSTLGHQDVNTTRHYLQIDIEGLRKCALDPEEVFKP